LLVDCAIDMLWQASVAARHAGRPSPDKTPLTVLRGRVRGCGSGRLSTMRFITIVEVIRKMPGRVASS
jgi:hypothetical protein